MNYKGLKKASGETRYCNKSGTFGECEIALNLKTGKIYATWRYGKGNFTMWHDENIRNMFYTLYPMSQKRIKERLNEEVAFYVHA